MTTTSTQKHSLEPWSAFDDDGTGTPPCILSNKVNAGGNFYVAQFKNFNDAVHAAACVNACKGIPTKALVSADVKKLVDVAKACENTYSDLADADDITETDNETWGQLLAALAPFKQEASHGR